MKATIYEIFEMSIGTSITTGYNWGRAGSEVRHIQFSSYMTPSYNSYASKVPILKECHFGKMKLCRVEHSQK